MVQALVFKDYAKTVNQVSIKMKVIPRRPAKDVLPVILRTESRKQENAQVNKTAFVNAILGEFHKHGECYFLPKTRLLAF